VLRKREAVKKVHNKAKVVQFSPLTKILLTSRKGIKEKLVKFTSLEIIKQIQKEKKAFILVGHYSESNGSKQ